MKGYEILMEIISLINLDVILVLKKFNLLRQILLTIYLNFSKFSSVEYYFFCFG